MVQQYWILQDISVILQPVTHIFTLSVHRNTKIKALKMADEMPFHLNFLFTSFLLCIHKSGKFLICKVFLNTWTSQEKSDWLKNWQKVSQQHSQFLHPEGSILMMVLHRWASAAPFAALLASTGCMSWTPQSYPAKVNSTHDLKGFSKHNVTLDAETCCMEWQQPAGQQILAARAGLRKATGVELSASCRPSSRLLKSQPEEEMFCFVLWV